MFSSKTSQGTMASFTSPPRGEAKDCTQDGAFVETALTPAELEAALQAESVYGISVDNCLFLVGQHGPVATSAS